MIVTNITSPTARLSGDVVIFISDVVVEWLILRRVQAARSGAEGDGHALRVFRRGGGAVPQACAAVNAFIAVEIRHAVFAGCDGLAGTHFDAQFRAAALALVRKNKRDVIGVAGRRLHLAAEQERVLMRDEQLAVVGNRRPAGAFHERGVRGNARAETCRGGNDRQKPASESAPD